jgi:hypothetical protein
MSNKELGDCDLDLEDLDGLNQSKDAAFSNNLEIQRA